MKELFTIKKVVTLNDIDTLNHVNNIVYLKWMEEIATKHWEFLTKKNPTPEIIWVVLRHEIDYLQQVILDDVIILKTRVGESKGFKSIRFIEFYKNDILIAKSKTIWGMLDSETFKPMRIREKVLKILNGNN